MKTLRYLSSLILFALLTASVSLISGCNKSDNVTGTSGTVNDYITAQAINSSSDGSNGDDNEALGTQVSDYDDGGATYDNDGGASNTPLDSLRRYGRRVSNVNVNTNITIDNDTLKTVLVTRTITGNFIIIGYINGVIDSISKPFTEVQKRIAYFKRVANSGEPRRDWRLYQFSLVDGQTTSPQTGKSNIVINKIEIYNGSALVYTFNGPDFTSNLFTTRFFDETRIPRFRRGDVIHVKVSINSNQTDPDLVSYHWARNSFGFHREPFIMTSQTVNGSTFDRTYEKQFTIYGGHKIGIFNGFLSANTKASLWDNDVNLFSSTYAGIPYRIRL
ncbi:hypothetical protein BH10BAC5_BH10BAC5_03950 [soil metagenome]